MVLPVNHHFETVEQRKKYLRNIDRWLRFIAIDIGGKSDDNWSYITKRTSLQFLLSIYECTILFITIQLAFLLKKWFLN